MAKGKQNKTVGALVDTARSTLKTHPNMTAEERQAVFATLKGEAETFGHEATMALREVSRILGISALKKKS